MKAFYFAPADNRLRYGDGREIIVGETHRVEGTPEPCRHGLHASRRLIDALSYAPGTTLYLVELGGQIVESDDKAAATERTYLARFDARELLIRFACDCALDNLRLIRPYTAEFDIIESFLKNPTAARAAADAADAADAAADAAAYAAAYAARKRQFGFLLEAVKEVAKCL